MKATITLFLSLLYLNTNAQWQQIYHSPTMGATQVEALNQDTLYVISGQWGPLVHTTNGGTTWDTLTFFNTQVVSEVQFLDRQHGYIAGATSFPTDPTFFKTSDGGATWQGLNLMAGPPFTDTRICFVHPDTGFVSHAQQVLKTVDGGNNFLPLAFDTGSHDIKDIYFINDRVGFIATLMLYSFGAPAENRIYKTIDQGATWTLVHSDNDMGNNSFVFAGITEIFFVNDTFGLAVGGEGKVLKTTNGGATWTNIPNTFNDYNITDVQFLTTTNGYICYAGQLYYTGDGMQTWQRLADPAAPHDLYCIDMLNANIGFAAGHGVFKTTNGGGITSAPEIASKKPGITVYPNPATDHLTIALPAGTHLYETELWSGEGRLLQRHTARQELNISNLPAGIYHLRMHTSKGRAVSTVIVSSR